MNTVKDSDGFVFMPDYRISVRADGAVKTARKGIHFGCATSDGYRKIRTSRGLKQVHRLIMEAFHGPSNLEVDHKNGIRDDNRLANLRYCTRRENQNNRDVHRAGRLPGCKPQFNKWYASIRNNGVSVHLGFFPTEEEAHNAYMEARRKIEMCEEARQADEGCN